MIKKRIPIFNFKKELINQLQGHYFHYKQKKKPIEREIVFLLADIILDAELYTLPSDYIEYLPIVRVDYGFERKTSNNWLVQYRQKEISYAIVNTSNIDIIEKVLLLSKSNITDVKNLNLFFFKYKDEWVFPTHCIIENDSGHQMLQFLKNNAVDEFLIFEYLDIMNKNYKRVESFVKNKNISLKQRITSNKENVDLVPSIFYEREKPAYRDETLKKHQNEEDKNRKSLCLFANAVFE